MFEKTRNWILVLAILGAAACRGGEPARVATSTKSLTGQQAIESLTRSYPDVRIEMAPTNLAADVEFVRPALVPGATSPTDAATRFLGEREGLFLPNGSIARPRAEVTSPGGNRRVVSFGQMLGDYEVFGGEIQFQFEGGGAAMSQITANVARLAGIDTTPALTEAAAVKAATDELTRVKLDVDSTTEPAAKLIIFSPALLGLEGPDVLTYQVDIGSFRAFVDADSGKIVHRYRNSAFASPSVFECGAAMTCRAAEPPPGAAETRALLTTLTAAYQYFLNVHQRDGFAATVPILGYSRYWIPDARYDPGLRQLQFSTGWVQSDIVAHEYTHGILFLGPRVEYTLQPGAVQEFFADVFAAMIDDTSPSRWIIGESLKVASFRRPLRDLRDPKGPGFVRNAKFNVINNAGQPDHVTEFVTPQDEICKTVDALEDNGCVHFNGAILSLAAVRAVDGTPTRAGIGKEKFSRIAYDAMIHLPHLPSLRQAADGLRRSCNQLAKTSGSGLTAGDCTSLDAAYSSVGLP